VLFNTEDKALNKNLHQFKENGSQRILTEFWRKKLKKRMTEHLIAKIDGRAVVVVKLQ